MTYRSTPRRCTLCPATAIVSRCGRCASPLCVWHTPEQRQHCDLCEVDWIQRARPQRTIPRPLLLVLVLGWCATAFIMANGCYIASVQWIGSAVFAILTLAFLAATQGAHFRVRVARWRFLREKVAGPRPLAELKDAAPSATMPRAHRPRLAQGSSAGRWKLQQLCR